MISSCTVPVAIATVALLTACTTPTTPTATTAITSTATSRARVDGERLPSVQVELHETHLQVLVTRAPLCGILVLRAGYRVRGRSLELVAHVAPHPGALCERTFQQAWVSVYRLDVPRPTPGRWQVRVFEGLGDRPPTLVRGGEIAVRIPDA